MLNMSENLSSSEVKKARELQAGAWMLRMGGLALTAIGIVSGLKTKDFGTFAGLYGAGTAIGVAGEALADQARKIDPTTI